MYIYTKVNLSLTYSEKSCSHIRMKRDEALTHKENQITRGKRVK